MLINSNFGLGSWTCHALVIFKLLFNLLFYWSFSTFCFTGYIQVAGFERAPQPASEVISF